MSFWTKDNVIQVHCELSTFCNAACPKCPRYIEGTKVLRPGLELEQITLEKFKKYFDVDFIKQSTQWLFCGTHGDPMMAKDAIEIVEYLYSINNDIKVRIHTNGGMRNEKDWRRLGEMSKATTRDNVFLITFSIDGLEDTNHLYRRNVEWDTLIRNVKAYIDAGGKALWDYLVFKHNQHQIEEAKNLAKNLGFKEFVPKRALGFEYNGTVKDVPVWDEDGTYTHTLEAPTILEYTNFTPEQIKDVRKMSTESHVTFYKKNRDELKTYHLEGVDQWDGKYWDGNEIDYSEYNCKGIKCKSKILSMYQGKGITGTEIFVTAGGILMPCCYIGTQLDVTYRTVEVHQLQKKLKDYGLEKFDLNQRSMSEILESGDLNELFAKSWDKQDNDRVLYCAYTCGENNPIDRIWTDDRQRYY